LQRYLAKKGNYIFSFVSLNFFPTHFFFSNFFFFFTHCILNTFFSNYFVFVLYLFYFLKFSYQFIQHYLRIKSCSVEVYGVIYLNGLETNQINCEDFILIFALYFFSLFIYCMDNISYFSKSNPLQLQFAWRHNWLKLRNVIIHWSWVTS